LEPSHIYNNNKGKKGNVNLDIFSDVVRASVTAKREMSQLPFTELDKVALALVEWMCPDLLSIQAQQGHVTIVSKQK
jgi:hypothetical protein